MTASVRKATVERLHRRSWLLLASSLTLSACIPRDAVRDEQQRVRDVIQQGTSVQAATETMVRLGYLCQRVAVDAASSDGTAHNFTLTDCSNLVEGSTRLHVCLMPESGRVRSIEFGVKGCV